MSRVQFSEDFFSPIHQENSDADCYDDSIFLSDVSNCDMTVSFTKSLRNKSDLEHSDTLPKKETNDLKLDCASQNSVLKESESSNVCTPVSSKNSVKIKRTSKSQASNFNRNEIDSKKNVRAIDAAKREYSSKDLVRHKKQETVPKEIVDDGKVKEIKSAQSLGNNKVKRHSRPTSLSLPKNDHCKNIPAKDVKKDKDTKQSCKNMCDVNDKHKSLTKHSKKRLESNELRMNNLISSELKDSCAKSTDLSSSTSHNSSVKEIDTMNQVLENSAPTQFQLSVERIVHDHISFECDKVRQNVMMQQMSFYRELNKLKEEIKIDHLETTERMFKIIEGLMEFNFALESKSQSKKGSCNISA